MRKKNVVKPFYPLFHESNDSLERLLNAYSMLYVTAQTIRDHIADKIPEEVLKMLDEKIAEVNLARSED